MFNNYMNKLKKILNICKCINLLKNYFLPEDVFIIFYVSKIQGFRICFHKSHILNRFFFKSINSFINNN